MIKNISNFVDHNKECFRLKFLGGYLLLTCLGGIVLNSLLLWTFVEKKELRTAINRFIIVITINNLIGCIIDLPMQIISSFNCE
jgi:hypothetical protein